MGALDGCFVNAFVFSAWMLSVHWSVSFSAIVWRQIVELWLCL